MSYILDALRKADAERERGSVPNIHARPLAAALPLDPASRSGGFDRFDAGTRRWLIGGAAAALAAIAALALLRLTAPDAPAVVVPAAPVDSGRASVAEPIGTAAPMTQPAPAPPSMPSTALADGPAFPRAAPAPLAVAPSYRPVPASPARPAAVAGTPRLSTAAAEPALGVAGRPATAVAGTPPTSAPAATVAAPPTAAEPGSPTAADSRVLQARELPDDIRRELPVLTVGGATYSENAASRMLIINGQVFHENDRLAPELVLERIQLRSAVLRYKGLRYSIAY